MEKEQKDLTSPKGSPRKRAQEVLNFVVGPKRKKNAVKELLNLDRLQLFLHKLIAEEEEGDSSRVEEFLSLFTTVLNKRPFSSLTLETQDKEIVGLLSHNRIIFADLEEIVLSQEFEGTIKKIFKFWDFKCENARRTLIDLYLLEGASLCGHEFLTVFTEFNVEATLENDTKLTGLLDYVTALPDETQSLADHLEDRLLGRVNPKKPFFTVVEAKRGESFGVGQTQLLGEMKVLAIKNSGPINGVLTDGLLWQFYRYDPKDGSVFSRSPLYDQKVKSKEIVTILKYWIIGKVPSGTKFCSPTPEKDVSLET